MPSECWAGETQNEGVALFFGGFKGFSRVPNLNYFLCSFCRVSLVFFFSFSVLSKLGNSLPRGEKSGIPGTLLYFAIFKNKTKKKHVLTCGVAHVWTVWFLKMKFPRNCGLWMAAKSERRSWRRFKIETKSRICFWGLFGVSPDGRIPARFDSRFMPRMAKRYKSISVRSKLVTI